MSEHLHQPQKPSPKTTSAPQTDETEYLSETVDEIAQHPVTSLDTNPKMSPGLLRKLQRTHGNHYVQRLLGTNTTSAAPGSGFIAGFSRQHPNIQRQAMKIPVAPVKVTQVVGRMIQLVRKRPAVTNSNLANYIKDLIREAPSGGTPIGDGSAMSACNYEIKTGNKVGGRGHETKCREYMNGIQKLIDRHNNPKSPFTLSSDDLTVAQGLVVDLANALKGDDSYVEQ